MKVFLLHRDSDFIVKPELRDAIFEAMHSSNLFAVENVKRNLEREREKDPTLGTGLATADQALVQDLELDTLWRVMAAGDQYLYETAKRVVLSSLPTADAIRYRQQVLADALANREVVGELYELALQALDSDRKVGSLWGTAGADRILSRSVQVLKLHVEILKRLRALAAEQVPNFRSDGFSRFFQMLQEELSDDYIETVEQHLRQLEFRRGVLESAQLGKGFKGRHYTVRSGREQTWKDHLPFASHPESYSFTLHPRDEAGFRALEAIRARGINNVANAVAQSADHVKSFFAMLRIELAFYLGCINLHDRLAENEEPICYPEVLQDELAFRGQQLYDVCLTFHLESNAVGNDVTADNKSLVMITGANQGGKSTFLRSVGLAQLMMQSGMFVGAEAFRANVCAGIFTHYKREEDDTMEGGKLDEELARMSEIAEQIRPGSLLLCNESFASTNEREGSEIARQVVRAMLAKQIKVFFVTHMYDLAHDFDAQRLGSALFLRAERQPDGSRTFRIGEGEPLPTSYGEDSYRRIFGASVDSQETDRARAEQM